MSSDIFEIGKFNVDFFKHGTDSSKHSDMTAEDDVYLLDDVKFLTAEWLNDKVRG